MVRKMYLTPPDTPEGLTCRTLKMPDSLYWLGIFNNALLTTVEAWRYEQVNSTDLTIEQTVAKAQEILDLYWSTSLCEVCTLPAGEPIMRVAPDGSIQWQTPSGWETPTGDYTPPTIPARSGGSAEDQRCLAAANAARVLELLYEDLSDSLGEGLTEGEALTKLLVLIATIIAAAIALWVAAIVAIVAIIFSIIYDTLNYVTEDLWDADFTKALTCIFYNCSTNVAGVITFDYQCVLDQLASQTDVTGDLTFDQLRLFGQMAYLLQIISGDGLNSAGATTSVTEYSCDGCEVWCYEFDFTVSADGWAAVVDTVNGGTVGSYSSGAGFIARYYPASGDDMSLQTAITFPSTVVESIQVFYTASTVGATRGVYIRQPVYEGTIITSSGMSAGSNNVLFGLTGARTGLNVQLYSTGTPSLTLTKVIMKGLGTNPFGDDNCDYA